MSYKCKAAPTGKDVVWLKTVVNIDSTTRMSASGHFGHGKVEWPKGTITWNPVDGECSDYVEELIAIAEGRKSHPNTIHPENNRYCANMPVELFELLYTNPSDYIKGTKVMAIRDCISGDGSGPNPAGHKVRRGEVLIITSEGGSCFWFAGTECGAGHFLPKDFIIIGKPGQYATAAALSTGTKLVAKKRAATKKRTTSDAIKPANEVQVGDTVRITKSRSNWNEEMDEYVGQEVVVTKVSRYGSDAVIEFAGSSRWSWCSDNKHFIVIKNAQPTQSTKHPISGIVPADQVQVGDIVRITKSSGNWNKKMDDYVGREVVVTAVHSDSYAGVKILFDRSGPWAWCSRNNHYVVISRAISGPGVVSGTGITSSIPTPETYVITDACTGIISHIDTPTKPEGSPIRVSTATVSPIRIPTPTTAQPKKVTRIIVEV